MLNLLLFLGFLLFLFVLLVWPTRKGAQWVGAAQTSYVMAMAAVLAGLVLSVIVSIPAAMLLGAASPATAGVMMFVVSACACGFAYAKVLETSFFGGITIYFVQSVFAILVALILGFGVMTLAPQFVDEQGIAGVEDVRTRGLRQAADAVCACGDEKLCLGTRYRELRKIAANFEKALLLPAEKERVAEHTQRAKLCFMNAEDSAAADTRAPP
ncbi:MAG TPA: hypothetical protein VIC61_04480 [Gammaproteobacteria bacterium]